MANFGFDPARLLSQLQTTGLAVKDNPLYQLLFQMIGAMNKLRSDLNGGGSGGGGGSSVIINEQNITAIFGSGDGDGGSSDISIPGPRGRTGSDGAAGKPGPFLFTDFDNDSMMFPPGNSRQSSGGSSTDHVVLSDGAMPPTPVNDGAGNFIYIPYVP